MSIGLLFWILMILNLVFGFYTVWPGSNATGPRVTIGNNLLLFIILFLLGWGTFGFALVR